MFVTPAVFSGVKFRRRWISSPYIKKKKKSSFFIQSLLLSSFLTSANPSKAAFLCYTQQGCKTPCFYNANEKFGGIFTTNHPFLLFFLKKKDLNRYYPWGSGVIQWHTCNWHQKCRGRLWASFSMGESLRRLCIQLVWHFSAIRSIPGWTFFTIFTCCTK